MWWEQEGREGKGGGQRLEEGEGNHKKNFATFGRVEFIIGDFSKGSFGVVLVLETVWDWFGE